MRIVEIRDTWVEKQLNNVIVEIRDTWVEKQLNNVVFSMLKDIINGYKDTLLRG